MLQPLAPPTASPLLVAPAVDASPLPAELSVALLQCAAHHAEALQHFPVRSLLKGQALTLPVLLELLQRWHDHLVRDRADIPDCAAPEMQAERGRVDAARQALAQVLDLARQLADAECARLLRTRRLANAAQSALGD